jgi:hypothetical protein
LGPLRITLSYKRNAILLLTSALVMAPLSFGSSVTWYLNDVTFSDGANASGNFVFNADTQTVSTWDISTTAGALSAFTYTPADSSGGNYFEQSGYQNEFLFMLDDGSRLLGMTPVAALTDAGGIVAIDLGGGSSVECDNCSPYRTVVSGSFDTTSPAPEPTSIGLLGLGLCAFGILAARVRNRSSRKTHAHTA